MNAQGSKGPGIDESYWQAILRQGESANEQTQTGKAGLWEGFPEDVTAAFADEEPPYPLHDDGHKDRWATAQAYMTSGTVLEIKVTGFNRGGLLVDWDGLRGFVPASHLSDFTHYQNEEARLAELERRVGTQLQAKIIELDAHEQRFILSQRLTTDETQRRAEVFARIKPGEVCQGRVTNLCSFGAFVDLGGIEGLIHISELSWGRVDHPRDVLDSGQTVSIYVMSTEPGEGRIALSLKRLLPDPWETVEERYKVGQLVDGVITNVVSFGAFTRIEEGLEGLIHVSELAEGSFLHPRNVVQEGEKVVTRVLSLDGRRRRMALSLRQVNEQPEAGTHTENQAGSVAESGLEDGTDKAEAKIGNWAASSAPATIYRS